MRLVIALVREAIRFDVSGEASRRRVVRLRLQALLAEARARSRFYARDRSTIDALLEERDDDRFFETFATLRPLERADLAERLDRITTDREIDRAAICAALRTHPEGGGTLRTARGDHVVFASRGTTGEPVHVVDRVKSTERVITLVLLRSLRTLVSSGRFFALLPILSPLRRLFRRRHARAQHPPLHVRLRRLVAPSIVVLADRAAPSVLRSMLAGVARRVLDMLVDVHVVAEETPPAEAHARIAHRNPEILVGQASRIAALARAQLEGAIAIDPVALLTSGERAEGALESMRRAWPAALVVDMYGTSETRAIATTCHECGELHVLEDLVCLELEDVSGYATAETEIAARVLCTPLENRTTPVLRYAIPDRIERLPDVGCRLRTARIRVLGRMPVMLAPVVSLMDAPTREDAKLGALTSNVWPREDKHGQRDLGAPPGPRPRAASLGRFR